MREQDWQLLLRRIASQNCTPFLGAGAAAGVLPLGSDIARQWAELEGYPLDDPEDLARVAQFLGVHIDAMEPKDRICQLLRGFEQPDFTRSGEPHSLLAQLPFPIFMTTNYDHFMASALRHHNKDPKIELCRWNASPAVRAQPGVLDDTSFVPTPANPVVYHLHGHFGVPDSLVLTEDDYFAFLVAVSRDDKLLPHQIQRALAGTSLLFIGYRLADWDFRVLHRGLVMAGDPTLRRMSVTVQLPHSELAQQYLDQYFDAIHVRVFWGTAEAFVTELSQRWENFDGR